jgi:excisionase family DNA binding protein
MDNSKTDHFKLWNIRQTAEATGLSVNTLYSWISQKKITYIKAGRKVLFDPRDLEKWVEFHKVRQREDEYD